jgi:hypothetical protein
MHVIKLDPYAQGSTRFRASYSLYSSCSSAVAMCTCRASFWAEAGSLRGGSVRVRSPRELRSQPAANKKRAAGNSSIRIVRFRIRKSLCVLNKMPALYFVSMNISLVKHCTATKQATLGIYVGN